MLKNKKNKDNVTKGKKTYDLLRDDILTGEFPPGLIITERDLVDKYKVSRSPIRHALALARESGLLIETPRKGYVVTGVSLADAQSILHLRLILEPEAAELACQYISENELNKLRELTKTSFTLGDTNSMKKFLNTNQEFHVLIAHCSHNRYLEYFISRLIEDMNRIVRETITRSITQQSAMIAEHCEIVDAIASRNPARARLVVQKAIDNGTIRVTGSISSMDINKR